MIIFYAAQAAVRTPRRIKLHATDAAKRLANTYVLPAEQFETSLCKLSSQTTI
jgi:hypothetical protein